MSKRLSTVLAAALAGVFLAAGSAGAAVAEWEWTEGVGNYVHFRPIDESGDGNNDSFEAVEIPSNQNTDMTWAPLSGSATTHNNPALRGDPDFNLVSRQPLMGEFIYSEGANVFDLDPWYGMPGLSSFAPYDGASYQFAGLWEFRVSGNGVDGIADMIANYGELPATYTANWNLDLANRPIPDDDPGSVLGPQNVVGEGGWVFTLTQNFAALSDWDTNPLTAWFQDTVHGDTWSGFHLLTDAQGDFTGTGYALLATNNPDLFPWLTNPGAIPISQWDTFTQGDQVYQHVGVTGVSGTGRLEVVPEPTSMVLLGLGLTGFATRRLISRKKKA